MQNAEQCSSCNVSLFAIFNSRGHLLLRENSRGNTGSGFSYPQEESTIIQLRSVDKSNWQACIQLRPRPEQEPFLASNLYSIAEAQFLDGFATRAVYCGDQMVGFAMFGLDSDDGNYWIYRFMIDAAHQGQGIGKAAMALVIDEIRGRTDRTDVILIGYQPDNELARRLYTAAGFVEEGIAPWGEMISRYRF